MQMAALWGEKRGARRPNLSISRATRTLDAICRIFNQIIFFCLKSHFGISWIELLIFVYFSDKFCTFKSLFVLTVSENLKQWKSKNRKKNMQLLVCDWLSMQLYLQHTLARLCCRRYFLFCFLNRDVRRSASCTADDVPSADSREVPHMKSSDLSFVVQSNGAALVLGSE